MAKWSINELRNRSGTSNKRRSVALGATGALVGAIVAPAIGEMNAAAFSLPPYYMKDVNTLSGTGYPAGATAVVVEGASMNINGCNGPSLSQVVNQTVHFMNSNPPRRTVDEITIYSGCDSRPTIGDWSYEVKQVIAHVESRVLKSHSKHS